MSDKEKLSVVIALGYFDSVHIGHKKVISAAVRAAEEAGVSPAVFSFDGNLRKAVGGADGKYVFTTTERSNRIAELGVKEIHFAPVTESFLRKSKRDFLDYLNEVYSIKGYVSGEDYRFGYKGEGDTEYLKEYAADNGQFVVTVKQVNLGAERVSTTFIKGLLKSGDVSTANKLLGGDYFISGVVTEGRKTGRKIGFPTVNIKIPEERAELKNGVYSGKFCINDKTYKVIVNYGARPTYGLTENLIEAHIIDFSGNLYGETLTVYFDRYLRDIMKFDGEAALQAQLEKDLAAVKGTVL